MQTIAVFALKGGVGKSALTVFLADFFSSVYDQRVLVVDLDPQQSTSVALLGEDLLADALEREASVGSLILDCIDSKQQAANVLSYITERPKAGEKRRFKYLQALSVLASDGEALRHLDPILNSSLSNGHKSHLGLLRNAFQ
jgi:cellulose biosynthesis protein BcsQ